MKRSKSLFQRLRGKLNKQTDNSSPASPSPKPKEILNSATRASTQESNLSNASTLPVRQPSVLSKGSGSASIKNCQEPCKNGPPQAGGSENGLNVGATTPGITDDDVASSDLWSAAYREAVRNSTGIVDPAILHGKSMVQLFQDLENICAGSGQNVSFSNGVERLRSLQVPLEKLKLALDLASPMIGHGPVSPLFNVVSGVAVVAITFASVDVKFAKQVGMMLEYISYIDDCDTLGQKSNREDIHKALVAVYQKILEFYQVAFDIVTRKEANVIKTVLETSGRIPSIVDDFLERAKFLQKMVAKATWEVTEDIRIMLYDSDIGVWLGSERMTAQSQYHATLKTMRADNACEFLLSDAGYIEWYQASDSRQLVILGDMGTGKSFSMAYLIDEIMQRSKNQLPQPKICYYYCRDDDTGQAVQIYAGLLLALMSQLNGLKRIFYDWYIQTQASGCFAPAKNPEKLEEFLEIVFETLDRPIFIVVDALDECSRESRNKLLKLLKKLSQKNSKLKILLSSRPQEEILNELGNMPKIILNCNYERDKMIVQKIVDMRLPYLAQEIKAFVIETVSRLAQGSAIWTKMTIELIELRGIRALGPMKRFLQTEPLPKGLSALFDTIMLRCTSDDPENMELARVALKLIAISRRPLSIRELACAAAFAAAQEEITAVADLDLLTDHQRLMGFIHPFVARIDFDDVKTCQIRLVHQSVKEFVIHEGGSTPQNQKLLDQRIEKLEAYILDISIRYLLLDDIGSKDLFSDEQKALEELPELINFFDSDAESIEVHQSSWEVLEEGMMHFDPVDRGFGEFFVYASTQWVVHFGAVKSKPLPDLANVETLCKVGSTRLRNWIGQNSRPLGKVKQRIEFDSDLYDPLSITALYGSKSMLKHMLKNSRYDRQTFHEDTELRAVDQILVWGDIDRLEIFFHEGTSCSPQRLEMFHLILKRWCWPRTPPRTHWEPAFELFDYAVDTWTPGPWSNQLLCMAANIGCLLIVKRLMIRSQQRPDVRAEMLRGVQHKKHPLSLSRVAHQSIGEAVLGKHISIIKFLVEQEGIEPHLRHLNSQGENVFHLAAKVGTPEIFSILASRFPEGIQQRDSSGYTPLMRAIQNPLLPQNRYDSAKVLLDHGYDTVGELHSNDVENHPLRLAVAQGDLHLCELLVCSGGMQPLLALEKDDNGELRLKDTPFGRGQVSKAILELLCKNIDTEPESATTKYSEDLSSTEIKRPAICISE